MERNKKVCICIPTLNQYHLLNVCLDSAERGTLVPDYYIIIDNGLQYNTIHDYENKKIVIKPSNNLGVAKSWNHLIKDYSDGENNILIICNDDIEFHTDTIEKLVNVYYENMEDDSIGIFGPKGQGGCLYSCFILNKNTFKNLGEFDEAFFPAYFEDCDYSYRMILAEKKVLLIEDCGYIHHHSSTIKSYSLPQMESHHTTFLNNKNYYLSKWGGEPLFETYKTPFNRG